MATWAAGWQAADVSNLPVRIDAGGVRDSLSGWLGGWTTRPTTPCSACSSRMPAPPILFLQSAQGALPVGTTGVVFSLSMERLSGGDNDGYADNLAFALAPVPEPQTYALMLAGLLAGGAAARAKRCG